MFECHNLASGPQGFKINPARLSQPCVFTTMPWQGCNNLGTTLGPQHMVVATWFFLYGYRFLKNVRGSPAESDVRCAGNDQTTGDTYMVSYSVGS